VNEFIGEQQRSGALAATYKKWVGADLPELKKP
jgi:ABC-type amino acid transport substrate-binding protein